MTIETRMARHKEMRASTLAFLQLRDAKLIQLREETARAEADKRVNEFRDEAAWKPGPNALLLIAGRLKVLAARLVS